MNVNQSSSQKSTITSTTKGKQPSRQRTLLNIAMSELESADQVLKGAYEYYSATILAKSNVLGMIYEQFGPGPFIYKGELVKIITKPGVTGTRYFTRAVRK